MQVQIPEFRKLIVMIVFEGPPMDSGILEDSGFLYTMQPDPCSHNLPLLIESNVLVDVNTRKEQEKIIYGGDYATWYASSPENNNIPISRRHQNIVYETTAKAGGELEIQWTIDGKFAAKLHFIGT